MRLEAIYDDGRLELPAGVHLKHSRIGVTVLIPEDEFAGRVVTGETAELSADEGSEEEPHAAASSQRPSIREAINEILGPWKQQIENGTSLTDEEGNGFRYEVLREKYLDPR